MRKLRNGDFLACDLVRYFGMIAGYISDEIGIIQLTDPYTGKLAYGFFFSSQAYVYREPYDHDNVEIFKILPVGLGVRFDGRCVEMPHFRSVRNFFHLELIVCINKIFLISYKFPRLFYVCTSRHGVL